MERSHYYFYHVNELKRKIINLYFIILKRLNIYNTSVTNMSLYTLTSKRNFKRNIEDIHIVFDIVVTRLNS